MMNNLNNQFEQENIEKSNIIKDSINNSQDMNKKEITKLENKDNNDKTFEKRCESLVKQLELEKDYLKVFRLIQNYLKHYFDN